MESCTTFSCYLQTLKNSKQLSDEDSEKLTTNLAGVDMTKTTASTDDMNNMTHDKSTFRIVFPVVIVISLLIVVAVGFLVHRWISNVMWSEWSRSSDEHTDSSTSGRFRQRRAENIETVSGHIDVPPTYKQVMLSIKLEKHPPTYYQVMSGAVNCGFVSEENLSLDHHDNFDTLESDDGEKGNTNSLVHSRTNPKDLSKTNRSIVVVHASDVRLNVDEIEDIIVEYPDTHSRIEQRNSSGSHDSVSTTLTVVDVNVTDSEHSTDGTYETDTESETNEAVCSAV